MTLDLRPGDHIFGFGSLVNAKTWPRPLTVQPATLRGWGREWRHSATLPTGGAVTALTIVPRSGVAIDGVIETLTEADIAPMIQREIGYETVDITEHLDWHAPEARATTGRVLAFSSTPDFNIWSTEEAPIPKSYVDCVMDGYEARFGRDGLDRFMASTHGWSGVIKDDRTAPLYPRWVALSADTHARYDDLIDHHRSLELG